MKKLLLLVLLLFLASIACSAEVTAPQDEATETASQAVGTCPQTMSCPTAQSGYSFMYTMRSYSPVGFTCWYTNGFGGQYSVVVAAEAGCTHCCPGGWGCPGWCPPSGICPNPAWYCQAT